MHNWDRATYSPVAARRPGGHNRCNAAVRSQASRRSVVCEAFGRVPPQCETFTLASEENAIECQWPPARPGGAGGAVGGYPPQVGLTRPGARPRPRGPRGDPPRPHVLEPAALSSAAATLAASCGYWRRKFSVTFNSRRMWATLLRSVIPHLLTRPKIAMWLGPGKGRGSVHPVDYEVNPALADGHAAGVFPFQVARLGRTGRSGNAQASAEADLAFKGRSRHHDALRPELV